MLRKVFVTGVGMVRPGLLVESDPQRSVCRSDPIRSMIDNRVR
jgi:hypothetical protein